MRQLRHVSTPILLLGLVGLLPGGIRRADAGCLDWLFGRDTTAYSIPATGYPAPTGGCGLFGDGGYAYNVSRIPTVAVPCTNYQTVAQRVPVSTYRPSVLGGLFGCSGSEVQAARVPVGYQTAGSPAVALQQVGTILVPAGNACAPGNPCATGACGTGLVAAQRPIAAMQTLRVPAAAYGCSTCSGQPLALGSAMATVPATGMAPVYGGPFGGMGSPSAQVMPTLSGSPYGGPQAVARPTLPGGWVPSGDPSTCSTCQAGASSLAGPSAGGYPATSLPGGGSSQIVSSRIVPADGRSSESLGDPSGWREVPGGATVVGGGTARTLDPAEQQPTLYGPPSGGGVVERPAMPSTYADSDDSRILSRPALRLAPEGGPVTREPSVGPTSPVSAGPPAGYSPGPSYYGGSAIGSGVAGSTTVRSPAVSAYGQGGYGSAGYGSAGYESAGYGSSAPASGAGTPGCTNCGRADTGARPLEGLPSGSRIVERGSVRRADRDETGAGRMSLSGLVRPPVEAAALDDARTGMPPADAVRTQRPIVTAPWDRGGDAFPAPSFGQADGGRLAPPLWSQDEGDRVADVPTLLGSARDAFAAPASRPARSLAALPADELPPLAGPTGRNVATDRRAAEPTGRADRWAGDVAPIRPVSTSRAAAPTASRFDDSGWTSGS